MKLDLDLVEAAVLAILTTDLAADKVNVAALSSEDLDKEGAVLTMPPFVRVLFDSEPLPAGRDNQRLTYQAAQNWRALVGVQNYRARGDERREAYQLLTKVKDSLAGARLQLDLNTKTPPVLLTGVEQIAVDNRGSVYSVNFTVEAIAQFSGQNG